MKTYSTDQIRNIALIGNAGSGKTSLGEAMLFTGGVIDRKGNIGGKNTASDYNEIEQQIGNSVFSTLLYTEYNGKKINIIDTPGADDFSGGVISAFSAVETAVMVVNAQNGIEVGTEIHGRHAETYNKPLIVALNQLDHEKANFETLIEAVKSHFGPKLIPVQFPVNAGPDFDSIVDVLMMKMYKFNKDTGTSEVLDIPAEYKDQADEMHNALVEAAAENDEALMELFFEKGSLDENEMRKGITLGIQERGMFPLFCISAENNIGVSRFLEFITNAAPAPDAVPAMQTEDGKEIECKTGGDASMFVFKTSLETHIGEVVFFKVASGEIKEGMDLTNNNTNTKERISQLFAVAGKHREKVPFMVAGDIGATVKLKDTKTNQTLTSGKSSFKFPEIQFLNPKHRTAIKAVNESDDEKLGEVLNKIHESDPTILVEYSKELKQIILSGQGEYHINNMVKWPLDNIHKIEFTLFAPRIPYRETITKTSASNYRHKKQSGGSGQFGEVHMVIEPYTEGAPDPTKFKVDGKEIKISVRNKEEHDMPWGGKLVYYNCIVGGAIDARFLPAILKGIMEKMEEGPLTGSYARDIKVSVYDGKMHPVDSNEISFKLAGRNAFREAFKTAGPKIMEPVYRVEVLVPSDRMGDVMSDLQGRRALIEGMSSDKGFEKIKALVPLAEMNKYSTALSSITGGRATYGMVFEKYEQVPMDIQDKLIKEFEEQEEEE